MPDTVWFHQSIEKSLGNLSRDFFVGSKTILLLPDSKLVRNSDSFISSAQKVAKKLQEFAQQVSVYPLALDGFESFNRQSTRFIFIQQPPLKVKSKNWLGRFADDEVIPVVRKIGTPEQFAECENLVCFGLLGQSARFAVSGLMSLASVLLPTATLAQIYMENVNGFMHRAYSEILASQIVPKNRFNFLADDKGFFSGKDIVAVEAAALKIHGAAVKDDKLIKESVRVNFGDQLLLQTFLEGMPTNSSKMLASKTNFQPKVDDKKCNFCLKCLDVCPNGSILVQGKKIKISNDCVRCGACVDECPESALH
jgi:Pyruvate/2-oxoacid:ferredoxin oxidoreductase delta subunit